MAKDFLLEMGSEEIPASFIQPALDDLSGVLTKRLAEARLSHGAVKTVGTPRRLAVLIQGVADRTDDVQREVLGPPVRAAFDKDGKPTKAAEKFAESVNLPVDKVQRIQTPKGEYLGARVEEKGKAAEELLKDAVHAATHGINFKKSMRWGDVDLAFARPLHWIVCLLGEEVLPVTFGDVRSGRTTYGHRFLAPNAIELKRPADYVESLRKAHVGVDIAERKKLLAERIAQAAEKVGARVLEDESLLDQVTNLVESPHPVVGTFEERHLDLPREVLIQEMKTHQRYFSLVDASGKLLPKFIAVSNTPVKDEKLSIRGYERVLRARLADGRFFFDEDRKVPLASRTEKLARVVWQGKLGSYADKVERFKALAVFLAQATGHSTKAQSIERASTLAKADLVTGMVGEFPELQGVMGREYAKANGESAEVALAIYEHYLPRSAQDSLPTQDVGALIGLADRVDTLCGIFAIGKPPTGQADPFGLRRACLAVVNIVLGRGYRFSLSAVIEKSLALYGAKAQPAVKDQVLEFFRGRLKSLWEAGNRADVVEAVLSVGFDDLVAARKRLEALTQIVGRPDFAPLAAAFKRVGNIVEKQGKDVRGGGADPQKLVDDPEKKLHAAYAQTQGKVRDLVKADDYAGALREITSLKPAVDLFFDKVMVMAEDKALRENRIRLLTDIGLLFGQVADFAKIQAEG